MQPAVDRRALVLEYLAGASITIKGNCFLLILLYLVIFFRWNWIDIEILATADVFIGSYSNVYALSAALRMSRYFPQMKLKQTCLIDYKVPGLVDHCEGSKVAKSFWASSFIDLGFNSESDGCL